MTGIGVFTHWTRIAGARVLAASLHVLGPGLLGVALTACTVGPAPRPPAEPGAWQAHRHQLAGLVQWTLTGRVALITPEEGWHASLHWRQRADAYRIRIAAPLGQGTVALQGSDQGVVLRTTRHPQPIAAPSAEQLLYRQLGWQVPVAGLRYWVRGIPDPAAVYEKVLDDRGRLATLEQSGWQVEFLRYTRVGDYELPEKIFMRNGEFQVRMVVRTWQPEG